MTGSRVRTSWADTIAMVDKLHIEPSMPSPPPQKVRQPPRKVSQRERLNDPVSVSLPIFEGYDEPVCYLDWELEVNEIFASHVFPEHKKVRTAVSTFTHLASIWWDEYCWSYPDYIPVTWDDLKLSMRYKFFPTHYKHNMLRKLRCLQQGSATVKEYYNEFETTWFCCEIEESENATMNRFVRGLTRDIQDRLVHKEYYSINRLFHLACKAEQEVKRRMHEVNRHPVQAPTTRVVSFASSSAVSATPVVVRVTPHRACDLPPPTVPTSSELSSQGNNKGTSLHTPHVIDICPGESNASCDELVELSTTMSTPHIGNIHAEFCAQEDNTSAFESEISNLDKPHNSADALLSILATLKRDPCQLVADLSDPDDEFQPTMDLSTSSVDIKPSNDLSAPIALIDEENVPCDSNDSEIGCDELVAPNNDLDAIFSNLVCYVKLDTPMQLSHALVKASELVSLPSWNSIYTPCFRVNVIGEYSVNQEVLVHIFCITRAEMVDKLTRSDDDHLQLFVASAMQCENWLQRIMLHAETNFCVSPHPEFKHASDNLFTYLNVHWQICEQYNDGYPFESFTYTCKTRCNNDCLRLYAMLNFIIANPLRIYLVRYYTYCCITTLIVQQWRGIKTDDIYIYHAYTLSLLLAYFQFMQSRGRLCFQEREDDEDMTPPDMATLAVQVSISATCVNYQVSSFLRVNSYFMNFMLLSDECVAMIFRNKMYDDIGSSKIMIKLNNGRTMHEYDPMLAAFYKQAMPP